MNISFAVLNIRLTACPLPWPPWACAQPLTSVPWMWISCSAPRNCPKPGKRFLSLHQRKYREEAIKIQPVSWRYGLGAVRFFSIG